MIFAFFNKSSTTRHIFRFLEGTLPKTWLACLRLIVLSSVHCLVYVLMGTCVIGAPLSRVLVSTIGQYSINMSAYSRSPYQSTYQPISWPTSAGRLLVDMLAYMSSDSPIEC